MAIELLTPILGSGMLADTAVHPSHLPERFGLLTLIVLGEEVVSVATATTSTNWNLVPTVAAVGGFAIAACLWWLYFNFLETSIVIRGIGSVHVYNYGHLPIIMGLTLIAVGTEHIIQEANLSVLPVGTSWALCGGVALYMGSISFIWIAACRRRFSWLLVASLAIALSLAIADQSLPPLVVEGLLLAMLVGKVTIEILRNKSTSGADEEKIIEIDTQY
jgi:low temperature requirement protein LtrA